MNPKIAQIYGNRLRIRVCGICYNNSGAILMINHGMLTKGDFWAPPGGGVDFGIPAKTALIKEFREETGLSVDADRLLFTCELVNPPLHAIELFFEVTAKGGEMITGTDPEMEPGEQIIREVRFMSFDELSGIAPDEKHGIFNLVKSAQELKNMTGYVKL